MHTRGCKALTIAFGLSLGLFQSASARTWYVKPDGTGDAPGVQAAINAASNGDLILLAAGYYGDVDVNFLGKAVVVRSESGPAATVLVRHNSSQEGEEVYSDGFVFNHGEGPSSVLSGVTIFGGIDQRHPNDCIGIVCDGASPTIENVYVTANSTGIVCRNGANPVIRNSDISRNGRGGVIILLLGMGIQVQDSSPHIINNVLDSNGDIGTGIEVNGGAPVIEGNLVLNHYISGIISTSSDLTLRNNTICYNGGIWSAVRVIGGAPTIERCIIAFNGVAAFECHEDASPTVTCCDVFGNAGVDTLCGIDGGNNIAVDPLLCGDYKLQVDSPCSAANSPCGQRIGALPVGCGGVLTITCPSDSTVPAFSIIETLELEGFQFTNIEMDSLTVAYEVTSSGKNRFVDNGDPASLSGTLILPPGATFVPPNAALAIRPIRNYTEQEILYSVAVDELDALFTCETLVKFVPPVPVLVQTFAARAVETGVRLEWAIYADEEVEGYRVYRRDEEDGVERLLNADDLLAPHTTTYLDEGVSDHRKYTYTLVVVLRDGGAMVSKSVTVLTPSTPFALYGCRPNPFNPSTRILFSIDRDAETTVRIYDTAGRKVRTLLSAFTNSGRHWVEWDGRDDGGSDAASGVYFVLLSSGKNRATRKIVLVK